MSKALWSLRNGVMVNGPSANDSRCRRNPAGSSRDAGRKECRFFQNTVRRLTNVDRDVLRHLVDQSPMILMSMRDDETEQRRVLVAQPGHVRQRNEFVSKRVQRPADVEDNPRPG